VLGEFFEFGFQFRSFFQREAGAGDECIVGLFAGNF
jgi:hypothetical protein